MSDNDLWGMIQMNNSAPSHVCASNGLWRQLSLHDAGKACLQYALAATMSPADTEAESSSCKRLFAVGGTWSQQNVAATVLGKMSEPVGGTRMESSMPCLLFPPPDTPSIPPSAGTASRLAG